MADAVRAVALLVPVLLLVAFQDPPARKLRFQVEHINLETKKVAPLKPEEAKSFAAELKELAGVQDAACTESVATVTLKPEGTLKLTELRGTGKKTLTYDGGKPVIVFNTIRLEGRVALTLHLEKNAEKVKDALKEMGWKDVTEAEGVWGGTVKTPVDVVTVVKRICAKTGAEYKIFEILKEITWNPPVRSDGK
ncbi:MAG TPA: hypothetical protein VJB14_07730 [Planctomycetota bacterium]|nr:hypothetical protein [Planctomycetota bacterium]